MESGTVSARPALTRESWRRQGSRTCRDTLADRMTRLSTQRSPVPRCGNAWRNGSNLSLLSESGIPGAMADCDLQRCSRSTPGLQLGLSEATALFSLRRV